MFECEVNKKWYGNCGVECQEENYLVLGCFECGVMEDYLWWCVGYVKFVIW